MLSARFVRTDVRFQGAYIIVKGLQYNDSSAVVFVSCRVR